MKKPVHYITFQSSGNYFETACSYACVNICDVEGTECPEDTTCKRCIRTTVHKEAMEVQK